MEYVGEHIFPGQLGRFFVSLAFTAAIVAAIAYYFYIVSDKKIYKKLARSSFLAHAVSVFGIVGTLFYLMFNHYFEYNYVWEHSSKELPLKYIFSAFWEGQEGSFILWLFWDAVLGCILVFTAKKWEAPSMIVFALVQGFLASMILGIYPLGLKIGSSPFVLMRQTAENIGLPWTQISDYLHKFPAFANGSGLNPLLQNYWMTIHPPTLFLGFASTLVPFAFAMSALFNKDYKGWVKPATPWAYFSVMILGIGILMGGAWAYEALSFGGFWAWDPVENSSLVPWLVMVAAAHLLLIVKHRNSGLPSAFFMVITSFLLVLYSTFLTRSGVLGDSSVHSFVDLGLSGQLLIYLLFFVLIAFGTFIYRYKHIPKSKKDDELSSREFWMFIGSLILLIASFQIIFTTSLPVINDLFGPDGYIPIMSTKMAPPLKPKEHYNSFQVPFAIVITFLVAIGQYLNYKHTSGKKFWRNLMRSGIVSIIVTALIAQLYDFWAQPLYLILLFAGILAVFSNIDYWLALGRAKVSIAGGSIAHVGFALIIVGALISNSRQTVISHSKEFLSKDLPSNENALIELNDSTEMGNYIAVWNGMHEDHGKQYYDVSYYAKDSSSRQKPFELHPFVQKDKMQGLTPNPSTKHFWDRDIYTHVQYSTYLDNRTKDGYKDEKKVELAQGDTTTYHQHFIIMDSLYVHFVMDSVTRKPQEIRLTAKLTIVNVMGQEYHVNPVYDLNGNSISYQDGILEEPGLKIRLSNVDPDKKKYEFTLWKKAPKNEKPFIIMKAIVFPMINLLWIGAILMGLGTGIALWQRIRKGGPKKKAEG